jgi:hypothetical protein
MSHPSLLNPHALSVQCSRTSSPPIFFVSVSQSLTPIPASSPPPPLSLPLAQRLCFLLPHQTLLHGRLFTSRLLIGKFSSSTGSYSLSSSPAAAHILLPASTKTCFCLSSSCDIRLTDSVTQRVAHLVREAGRGRRRLSRQRVREALHCLMLHFNFLLLALDVAVAQG